MAEVSVRIAGRPYPIQCADGEEARVAALADRIDAEAQALSRTGGSISEARLLLMSALMLADKLDETEVALTAARDAPPPPPPPPQSQWFDEESAVEALHSMSDAAMRIEALRRAAANDDGSETAGTRP